MNPELSLAPSVRQSAPTWLPRLGRGLALLLCCVSPLRAGWGSDSIRKECDYLVDCSFTEYAQNHPTVNTSDDAYGCVNIIRISTGGKPDWVESGVAAMGMVGLMGGAQALQANGEDITTYKEVLERYYYDWMLGSGKVFNSNSASSGYGGAYSRIYYTTDGAYSSVDGSGGAGPTSGLIIASWKYYEFLKNIGDNTAATDWLNASWPTMKLAGDFLKNSYNSTYKLMAGAPSAVSTSDLWVNISAIAHPALNCLERYCAVGGFTRSYSYTTYASNLRTGLSQLKDPVTKNFFRYRQKSSGYAPVMGACYDTLCHVPYETGAIVPDADTKALSDWWVENMTYPTANTGDWRYYGTNWHLYFAGDPENDYLYPGPGLQIAKTEFKYYKISGNSEYRSRAARRLQFANGTLYSNLWFGATGQTEQGVPNGLVDWRDSLDYNHKAADWARFTDTSAYFIQVVLMIIFNQNPTYQPVL